MKKVLFVSPNSSIGGVSKYILEIIKNLPENILPFFVVSDSGYYTEELAKLGYKDNIFYIPITNKVHKINTLWQSIYRFLEIIKKIKPNLIYCNTLPASVPARISGLLKNIPVIYVPHGWAFIPGGRKLFNIFLYGLIESILSIITNKIICVSEYERQLALKIMPFSKNKLITIHNGISDIDSTFSKKSFSNNELKMVMISRFCPQKDPYTLIKAVALLCKEGLNIKLDLYGYGEELEKVINLIKECNTQNIQYKGEIADVTPILNNYDIYALISNWEGLPIGIIEAMRAGLPILVSDVGGNKECIRENGYLVKRQNINECCNQIRNFAKNIENLHILGENSNKFYKEEFTAKKLIQKVSKLIEEIIR